MPIGRVSLACALFITLAVTRPAHAQNPPAGAIFDLSAQAPFSTGSTLPTYTEFTTGFTADITGTEFVSFAFREVPAFFALDDVSVVDNADSSVNLLTDGDFESDTPANVATNFPVGWGRWIQAVDTTAIGEVASNTNSYGCNQGAHGGTYFWCDGSVEGFDALYQPVATTLGDRYTIHFWLQDDAGSNITNPTIDALVYAGDSLPVGSVTITGTPEPASIALLGIGLIGVSLVRRRRTNSAA